MRDAAIVSIMTSFQSLIAYQMGEKRCLFNEAIFMMKWKERKKTWSKNGGSKKEGITMTQRRHGMDANE